MSAGAAASALILFAHGSRDPQWAEPMRRIQAEIERRAGAPRVTLAFLEFTAPDLATAVGDAVAAGARRISIAPLFLGQGGHLRRDLASLVADARSAHPAVAIDVLPAIGEMPEVLAAIAERLTSA